jgi:predicted permease
VLWKDAGFTAVAVLSLALGVGANTAIFQLLDAIRMRTLPVKAPQELAGIQIANMSGARGAVNRENSVTYPIWERIQKHQQGFSGVFAWAEDELNLSPAGEVRTARSLWVSGDFFKVLGSHPVLGRVFTAEDDHRGCGIPGVVISYSFWQSEFGGSPSVIGRELTLNGQRANVIGVTQAGFFGLDVGHEFQIALPICSIVPIWYDALDNGTSWWLSVMGRLKPGLTVGQAAAQLSSISRGIFETTLPANYPPVSVNEYLGMRLTAVPAATGSSGLRDQYSNLLWMLLAIAGMVLLIACANLANLMLARAGSRGREIAVRLAIGGSPGRILCQLLTESALVTAVGAGAALLLSHWLSGALLALFTEKDKWVYVDLRPDWRVLAFTSAVAVATCLIFGLVPALRAAKGKPAEALKSGSRALTAGREAFGLRRALIVSQVALSLLLLFGALLFTSSVRNLLRAETGFQPQGILIANLGFARPNPSEIKVPVWQKALLERVGSVPGVTAVADTDVIPIGGRSWSNRVWMNGADPRQAIDTHWSRISAGYFRTLDIPMLTGRDFDVSDRLNTPKVAIVNQAFARQIAGLTNPVGQRFRVEATPSTSETVYEIIAMVGNTKYRDLRENAGPLFYVPFSQDATPTLSDQLLIRSSLPFQTLLPAVRRAILNVDSDARFEFDEYPDLIQESFSRERLMAMLSTAFAILAGLLSAVGLYGVMTYIVARRRSEIGIRIALGASRGSIFRMLFGESGKLLLLGLLAGAGLSLGVGKFASKLLFGLKPYDPSALITAAVLLLLVGFVATYVPARRAASIDPTVALREE